MGTITLHVLDLAKGRPAQGIPVTLEVQGLASGWKLLGRSRTDADGRSADVMPSHQRLQPGTYRLTLDTATYFQTQRLEPFYPDISVVFTVRDPAQHYHIPLLLSPFGEEPVWRCRSLRGEGGAVRCKAAGPKTPEVYSLEYIEDVFGPRTMQMAADRSP
jgi:5-hydroxyisourate hydrolase